VDRAIAPIIEQAAAALTSSCEEAGVNAQSHANCRGWPFAMASSTVYLCRDIIIGTIGIGIAPNTGNSQSIEEFWL
jgi:hypothetical protein